MASAASNSPFPPLEKLARDVLVDQHGESQDRRRVGYVRTQSLKKVVDALDDPSRIQAVSGTRRADQTSEDLFGGEQELVYLDAKRVTRDDWKISYDRAIHRELDWECLSDRLTENRSVWDFPVRRLVVRLDDDELLGHWKEFIEDASERHPAFEGAFPTGWVKSPFFAVMETAKPGTSGCRDNIESFHEDEPYYFMPRADGDETHAGMGWSPRPLDLTAVWSYRAFIDKQDVPVTISEPKKQLTADGGETERLTPRAIEAKLVNYSKDDSEYYGAVNSLLSINKWRRAFGRGATGLKPFHWNESGEWEQADGGRP